MEDSPRSGMSSPEAKLGMQVEDLWDIQEPQLSPSEKLNSCFESIPVSSFPPAPSYEGIAVWLLHQSEVAALGMIGGSAGTGLIAGGLGATVSAAMLGTPASAIAGTALAAAAGAGVAAAVGPAHSGPEAAATTGGSFFETLTSSEFYKNTKVRDISGSFRWAPFLALQKSNSFLTMLLLLSKYKMKSLPVVDLGEGKIDNIITQSAVVHMLVECAGLHWFESWGTKKLSELGLPIMRPNRIIKVYEDEPVLQAFKLMREKGIGGIPVVDGSGRKAIGNISIRDVQFLLTAPEIYKDYRSITARTFLTAVRNYLEEHQETSAMLSGTITCRRDNTIKEVILKLDSEKDTPNLCCG
ncbi:hypothetical protein HHK36_032577 [Tetracentron sinense]|uniref:CBS domain-containing protein n=1 Tax=Tetracentron sinense TaxID=13715 RepID=A0A835D0B0_TETSI|nr:hypothetical protein HHK36_032577 [Tetracentron sinense]